MTPFPYEIGSRVCLNSGGPEMLVVDLVGSTAVVVAWPDNSGRVHECAYAHQCVYLNTESVIQSSI
jgi:uncharacterized protein YodC (DUF2158 family)